MCHDSERAAAHPGGRAHHRRARDRVRDRRALLGLGLEHRPVHRPLRGGVRPLRRREPRHRREQRHRRAPPRAPRDRRRPRRRGRSSPTSTFAATAHTVLQTGAVPVLADVSAGDLVPRSPRRRTRRLAAHQGRRPRAPLRSPGRRPRARRDRAPARRSACSRTRPRRTAPRSATRRPASLGDVAAFSFYGNKLMTTGEGGMLTTNDDALARRCRFLKDHGMSPGGATSTPSSPSTTG